MSIPRVAIERPVTMFMLSAVIVLLGGISLFRLPVDLMPDVTYPSITVRVGYGGVGPAEIEELIVRPLEQTLAAVPGARADELDGVGGLGHGAAELRVGHEPERGGRRSANARRPRARPAAAGGRRRRASRSSTRRRRPSWASASRATTTASRCARWPSSIWCRASSASKAWRPSRSTAGCAARFTSSCRRRRSRRSICRSIASSARCAPRTRTSRSAKSTRATPPTCCAARASSRTSSRFATWSC